jgi:lethal(2) giant larvae protein
MFKFATNKFSSHNHGSSNNTASSNQTSAPSSLTTSSTHHHQPISLKSLLDDNSQASRRRQIQKDLFAFNKIADKGFPSKPSAMDYDKKLKLLALGTKNGDIRIYGSPGTNQQQLSCYQDVHPFPILRLLFIQGQYQLITLSERVYRNDSTNKAESQLYLVLWQIPNNIGYELNNVASNLVEKIKEYQLDPKIVNGTRLSAITLLNDNSHLFLGFETGDVYVFNVSTFQIVPGVINKDYILKNLPDPQTQQGSSSSTTPGLKKLTQLGAVESICHHPRQLTKLLIAYQRGLWVVFDFIKNQIDQINQTPQQLESAVFYQAGECVATSHSDGSFILWDLETTTQLNYSGSAPAVAPCAASSSAPNVVYGPYPCKAVTKCLVKTCRNDQPFVIFSGGCPRVNYSDKINISVIQGENAHVCFDFTSKIIDFFTIDKPIVEKQPVNSNNTGTSTTPLQTTTVSYDNPQALFVLLEEEFVAIDLVSDGWPQFKLPYLYSVHSSAIICTHYVNGVSKPFYDKLKCFGSQAQDASELYSEREWPISSSSTGSPTTAKPASSGAERKDILLTGHEDGSVRFWDVTQMSMTLLYKLKTGDYFQTDSTPVDEANPDGNENDSDNWPPFRKVGTFDPYSDDPKLGIQKIFLCAQREILVVAGTAGQVLLMSINEQARELPFNQLTSHKINIIGVSPEVESHFVWKGHEPLALRGHLANTSLASSSNNNSSTLLSGSLKLSPGYQLHSLIQLYPPATVSALALNTDWQLVGMGTSHGFALFDYFHVKDLLIRCTLDPAMLLATNPNDSGNTGTTISRRKSLKKSLRESFRKLRRGRSQKPNPNKAKAEPSKPNQMRVEHIDDNEMDGPHKPIERQVESREFKPMDDIPPSVIRYMYFVRTFITSNQQQTNSLWVGTNTGVIYIYALQFLLNTTHAQLVQTGPKAAMSSSTIRSNQSINCLLAKEMRLKHRAPVVHIQVIDQNMQPLPIEAGSSGSETAEATSLAQQNHKVIICSEEQFKVFQLPTLKPVCKFKLTAVEGARVRRIGYNCYTSKNDAKYSEYCLSCLSNLGDLSVYSLPQLKRQVQIQCMKQQDINAITSFVFSKQGQAFYLQSPSEFVHISMSARDSPQQLSIVSAQKGSQKQQTSGGAEAAKPKTTSNKNPAQPGASSSSAAKPQAESGGQSTVNNNNSNNTGNQAQLQSPMTPPPPVPAPRTTLASESGSNR